MEALSLPLQEVQDQVWAEVRQAVKLSGNNQTEGFWENAQAFAHAVDWTEPWIQGLLAAHVLTFALVVLFRRSTTFLTVVFFVLGALVYFGERVNALAAAHWDRFATQDYFDAHGIFYCVVVAAPAVFNLFAVLIFYLIDVAQLMVVVKRRELMHKAKARAKAERSGGGGGGGGGTGGGGGGGKKTQ